MINDSNKRIVGAFVVGFAMVALAYTVGSILSPAPSQQAALGNAEVPLRTAIEVSDENGNGIEDWRDDFVVAEPIVVENDTVYNPPTSLTGRLGVNFFENILGARTSGPFSRSEEEVIADTVDSLAEETAVTLYSTRDISIIPESTDANIKNYANAMASAIINNDIDSIEDEISILYDVVRRGQSNRIEDLNTIASVYRNTRDTSISIPVPAILSKEHLDLINAYHALAVDIEAMSNALNDPAVTLLRLKRYEDDALGLALALENMYLAIEPYSSLFGNNDSALLFANFNPNNNQI